MALPINIEDLLNKQRIEGNRLEFKKGSNPAKTYQSICAFANDFDNIGGGYIIIGVEEENGIAKRPVLGISEAELDRIWQAMEDAVVNALYHRDYQQYEPVEIHIQPEGITILSHSGLDGSISDKALREARFLQARRYRNRRLGDFLTRWIVLEQTDERLNER